MLILIVLPGFSSMVPVARMAVRNLLPGWPRVDDAELIISEFATTAVRHSTSRGDRFELSLDVHPGRLRIELRDGGPFGYPPPAPLAAPPFPAQPWTTLYEEDQLRDRDAELEEYSLGLAIINAASDRWGHSRYPDHEVWWAELAWPKPDPKPGPFQSPAPDAPAADSAPTTPTPEPPPAPTTHTPASAPDA